MYSFFYTDCIQQPETVRGGSGRRRLRLAQLCFDRRLHDAC